jgi:DNA-binding SARP family transcriptional activator
MSGELDFRILGPLEVRAAGAPLPLRHGRQRLLLATLLLAANEVVASERLVEELWPGGGPETAATVLHGHVSALRKLLGRERVITRPPGYLLRLDEDELDLARFEKLRAQARATTNVEERAELLEQALALWRGEPLADVPYEGAPAAETRRLEELRLATLEDRLDADLAGGRHAELVAELERLIDEHPLRERPRAQLMLALYRSGRQAEALQAYSNARRTLVDEIGIEPGPALRELERQILDQDPRLLLAPEEADAPVAPPAPAVSAVRKRVTVLVAAIAPPPAADSARDPEALARFLAASFESARPVFERHGAHVERVLDDSLLAVFGIPRLHDDDALRAVRAAAELRGLIDVHVGIATGEVLLNHDTVTGAPLALAGRLRAIAALDEIVLSEDTLALVRDAVVVDPIDGEPSPGQPAWRLREVHPGVAGVARQLDAPLIGRERELAELERALERAFTAEIPQLFTLLGAAGIGKSRLAAELMSGASGATLLGRCQPYGEGITYWPLAEIIGQLVPGDRAAGLTKLVVGERHAETIVERLLDAVGAGRTGVSTREEIFWAVGRFVDALARRRPLLLVFEDVHWAEPTFLDLVEYLAGRAREIPLFLLCIARLELLEERESWAGGKPNASSMLLEELSSADSELLLTSHAAADDLDAAAREQIVRAAGGNPLFLEQMAAAALAEGSGTALRRPATIDALLAARLDRLGPLEREAIECAAVQGAEFWAEALRELLPDEASSQTDRTLSALVSKELIRPSRPGAEGHETFRFKHELIRQAAYEGATKAARADLHERLADWLEATDAAPGELLGYHLEQAFRYGSELQYPGANLQRLAVRAGAHLGRSGLVAFSRGDVPAAINLLERAITLAAPDAGERTAFLYGLGAALAEAGELTRGEAMLVEACDRAETTGDDGTKARAILELGSVRMMMTTETRRLLTAAEESYPIAQALADDQVLAKALYALGLYHFTAMEFGKAVETLEKARTHAHAAGDGRGEADILFFLGASTYFGPSPAAAALPQWERLVEESRASPALEAASQHTLGSLYGLRGQFDAGRAAIGRALELYAELGMSLHEAGSTYSLAELESWAGNPDAAERAVRPGYDTFAEMGGDAFRSGGANYLARAAYDQGRYEDAEGFNKIVKDLEDEQGAVYWRTVATKLFARRGAADEAIAVGREAVALAKKSDSLIWQGRTLMDLAEAFFLLGYPREAAEAAEEALQLHERKQNLPGAEQARAFLSALS